MISWEVPSFVFTVVYLQSFIMQSWDHQSMCAHTYVSSIGPSNWLPLCRAVWRPCKPGWVKEVRKLTPGRVVASQTTTEDLWKLQRPISIQVSEVENTYGFCVFMSVAFPCLCRQRSFLHPALFHTPCPATLRVPCTQSLRGQGPAPPFTAHIRRDLCFPLSGYMSTGHRGQSLGAAFPYSGKQKHYSKPAWARLPPKASSSKHIISR